MRHGVSALVTACVVLAAGSAAMAASNVDVTFLTTGFHLDNIGSDGTLGNEWGKVDGNGVLGTVSVLTNGGPVYAATNTQVVFTSFTPGVNTSTEGSFELVQKMTVRSMEKDLIQHVDWYADTQNKIHLSIRPGNPVSFDLGEDGILLVTPDGLGLRGNMGYSSELQATFRIAAPVPEPVTFVTSLIVVGGLGAYIRRRTRAAKV